MESLKSNSNCSSYIHFKALGTVYQLEQVVFFNPDFGGFLERCELSKNFFSETMTLLLKTVSAFEKQYLDSTFLNLQ